MVWMPFGEDHHADHRQSVNSNRQIGAKFDVANVGLRPINIGQNPMTKKVSGSGLVARSGGVRNGVGGRFVSAVSADCLTEPQSLFVAAYVRNGGCVASACRSVGLSEHSGPRLLRLPHVREAIQTALDLGLRTEGAALAWGCIRGLMQDPATPANVRLQAARWTLEHAGMGLAAQQTRLGLPAWTGPLADMDEHALQAFVQAGADALASLSASEHPPACLPADACPDTQVSEQA